LAFTTPRPIPCGRARSTAMTAPSQCSRPNTPNVKNTSDVHHPPRPHSRPGISICRTSCEKYATLALWLMRAIVSAERVVRAQAEV